MGNCVAKNSVIKKKLQKKKKTNKLLNRLQINKILIIIESKYKKYK